MDAHPFIVIEQLGGAGKRLRAALDEYLGACSRMDGLLSGMLQEIPQGYLRHINEEIMHFPSYEPKLRRAEATVCRVRNRLSRLAPISSLPPEILVHIFHLVAKPCDLMIFNPEDSDSDLDPDSDSDSNSSTTSSEDSRGESEKCHSAISWIENFPTHLDHLTHVCSYWRQIAIGSPSLWTHIDIIPHKSLHRGILTRAEAYAARSAGLPIELHIEDDSPLAYNHSSLSRFLVSVYTRIESLNIALTHSWRRFYDLILDELFYSASQPTILTKITASFPMAGDVKDEFIDWIDETNNTFLHPTILHLHGLFPRWDSSAYRNLADLRLISPRADRWAIISESQLRNILEASSRLRILYFALQIIPQWRNDESMIPVHLNDLEVLRISTHRGEEDTTLRPGYLLRLVAPGSQPLRLSIWHSFYIPHSEDHELNDDKFSMDELVKFFRRSNVVKFSVRYICPPLGRLLCHAPNLEDLALESCVFPCRAEEPFLRGSPATSRLNSVITLAH